MKESKAKQNNSKTTTNKKKKNIPNSISIPLNSTEQTENAPAFFLHYFMGVFHSQLGMAVLRY